VAPGQQRHIGRRKRFGSPQRRIHSPVVVAVPLWQVPIPTSVAPDWDGHQDLSPLFALVRNDGRHLRYRHGTQDSTCGGGTQNVEAIRQIKNDKVAPSI
jgi:hypothetical protein